MSSDNTHMYRFCLEGSGIDEDQETIYVVGDGLLNAIDIFNHNYEQCCGLIKRIEQVRPGVMSYDKMKEKVDRMSFIINRLNDICTDADMQYSRSATIPDYLVTKIKEEVESL